MAITVLIILIEVHLYISKTFGHLTHLSFLHPLLVVIKDNGCHDVHQEEDGEQDKHQEEDCVHPGLSLCEEHHEWIVLSAKEHYACPERVSQIMEEDFTFK